MPSLIVTLKGNAADYEAMLARSVKQADVAGAKIAASFKARQQYATKTGQAVQGPLSEKERESWRKGQQEWNAIQAAQAATMLSNFEKQRIAAEALKEEAWAANAALIASSNSGGGGHGGMSGIIRETLVLMREASRGNWTRMSGSITLLAQYMGLLNKAVKSTAAEAVIAAASEKKLALSMAVTAARAKGTAGAEELLTAARAQATVAAEAETIKTEELAIATVTLNPIFFAVAGAIVAAGAAAFFIWRHFHNAAIEAKNLADALNPLKKKFTELAEAQERAAAAAQKEADYLRELTESHKSEADQIERKIRLLKLEAEARGWSDEETLKKEKELLEAEQQRLTAEAAAAAAAAKAASDSDIAGATMKDEHGDDIDLEQAKDRRKRLGEIVDAARAAMEAATVTSMSDKIVGNDFGAPIYAQVTRPANESDVLKFKVGEKDFQMTVAEATKNFQMASDQAKKLAQDQKALDDVLSNSNSTAKEKQDALNKVTDDLEDVNDQLKYKAYGKGGGGRAEVSERERIGAYRGGAGDPILLVSQNQYAELMKHTAQNNQIIAGQNQIIAALAEAGY